MRILAAVVSCVFAALAATTVQAQAFPTKPVRIVVPYAPGGGTDIISRQLAQKLTEAWGQSVFVENRLGANGITGTDFVLKSAPDGHNVVVVVAAHVINSSLMAKMPFDPVADVAPVTLIAQRLIRAAGIQPE